MRKFRPDVHIWKSRGKMSIPTGAAANKGFDVDEVNSKIFKPAVALTAIGAEIEIGRATP
jgi:hypothetical protein